MPPKPTNPDRSRAKPGPLQFTDAPKSPRERLLGGFAEHPFTLADQVLAEDADPLRPVDWRSRTANAIVRNGQSILSVRDDFAILRLVEYLRRRQRRKSLGGGLGGSASWDRLADVRLAVELRQSEHAASSVYVEARLLAGQAHDQIGTLAGVPAGVIALFRDYFFDVESRLNRRDFILREVVFSGGRESHTTAAIKFIGFLGGLTALNQLVESVPSAETRDLVGLAKHLDDRTAVLLDVFAYLAMRYGDPSAVGQSQLLAYAAQRALERPTETPMNGYERQVMGMLRELPWIFGDDDGFEHAKPEVRELLGFAAELRDDELLKVCAGTKMSSEELARLEEMRTFTLPPPRRNLPPSNGATP